MEYFESKIEFCKNNPNFTLNKEIKQITEINMFLNKTKAKVQVEKKAHYKVRRWLKKHNLPLEVVKEEYDVLNGLYHEVQRKEREFKRLNKQIRRQFKALDRHEVLKAVSLANERSSRNQQQAPKFEQIMFSYSQNQKKKLTDRRRYTQAMRLTDDYQLDDDGDDNNPVRNLIIDDLEPPKSTPKFGQQKIDLEIPT